MFDFFFVLVFSLRYACVCSFLCLLKNFEDSVFVLALTITTPISCITYHFVCSFHIVSCFCSDLIFFFVLFFIRLTLVFYAVGFKMLVVVCVCACVNTICIFICVFFLLFFFFDTDVQRKF